MPRPKNNKETENIRRLIGTRLGRDALESGAQRSSAAAAAHLDEDSLSVFIEGRLSEDESAPFISHLVACGFCRRITADLIRLDSELGPHEEGPATVQAEDQSGRLRRFLSDLAARVLDSSGDDAVFAYHAPAEDFQRAEASDRKGEGAAGAADERQPGDDSEGSSL